MIDIEISKAINVLQSGGIILYPTDTIWGIGCDATNYKAIERIYKIKKRNDTKSMLILVDSEKQLKNYVETVPSIAYELFEKNNRPLTLIYPNATNLATNIIGSDGSIGIRITKDLLCNRMIKKFSKPIVSTSANISGEIYPNNFSEISNDIIDNVDYIVNYKKEDNILKVPSDIIKVNIDNSIEIIRKFD